MSADLSFPDLMAQLRAGDEQAAEQIFRRYAQALIALAHQHLDTLIRQKVDPEDVVQSVFRSFFRRLPDAAWNLPGWSSLWRLLTTITLNKCGHWTDFFRAAGRDVYREVALPSSSSTARWEVIARAPTPAEAAMLAETLEQVMRDLEPRERIILELTLQGETANTIAGQLRCSERTVERVLSRVRRRLERLREADAAES